MAREPWPCAARADTPGTLPVGVQVRHESPVAALLVVDVAVLTRYSVK